MPSTQSEETVSIQLPAKLVQRLRDKVTDGEFASEAQVIEEGLHSLDNPAISLENWMIEEAKLAYDESMANPSSVVPIEEVMRSLEAAHRKSLSAK